MTAREAVLRNGASRDADTLSLIGRGGLARVIAASQGALRVLLPDESTGYLDPQALTSVARPLLRARLDSGTVLRESPGDRAPAVELLTGAAMGEVLGRFGDFALVRVPDAGTGWVAAHMIGLPPSCCQR